MDIDVLFIYYVLCLKGWVTCLYICSISIVEYTLESNYF